MNFLQKAVLKLQQKEQQRTVRERKVVELSNWIEGLTQVSPTKLLRHVS